MAWGRSIGWKNVTRSVNPGARVTDKVKYFTVFTKAWHSQMRSESLVTFRIRPTRSTCNTSQWQQQPVSLQQVSCVAQLPRATQSTCSIKVAGVTRHACQAHDRQAAWHAGDFASSQQLKGLPGRQIRRLPAEQDEWQESDRTVPRDCHRAASAVNVNYNTATRMQDPPCNRTGTWPCGHKQPNWMCTPAAA